MQATHDRRGSQNWQTLGMPLLVAACDTPPCLLHAYASIVTVIAATRGQTIACKKFAKILCFVCSIDQHNVAHQDRYGQGLVCAADGRRLCQGKQRMGHRA